MSDSMTDTLISKIELDPEISNDALTPDKHPDTVSPYPMVLPPESSSPHEGPPPAYSEVMPGTEPLFIECPLCCQKIITTTVHRNSKKTHCLACVICILGGIFCAIIPYLLKAYNKVEHYCPNCNSLLGIYEKNK